MVHLYTASSAGFGLWAIVAAIQLEFRLAIYLMLLTLVIDSTDGALARLIDVRRRIPWMDGRRLDDICDYFTYVLVPAVFLIQTDLLPHPSWAALPVLASAYGFSQSDAKTEDHFLPRLPLVLERRRDLRVPAAAGCKPGALDRARLLRRRLRPPPLHLPESHTRALRALTLSVLGLWVVGFSWIAVRIEPDPLWLRVSLLGPAYYLGASLLLNLRGLEARTSASG